MSAFDIGSMVKGAVLELLDNTTTDTKISIEYD